MNAWNDLSEYADLLFKLLDFKRRNFTSDIQSHSILRLLADAKSKHHLISTVAVPGVYKSPFKGILRKESIQLSIIKQIGRYIMK